MRVLKGFCGIVLCLFIFKVTANMLEQNQTKEVFLHLANDYEIAYFDRFPELGVYWGRLDVPLDRFTDHSLTALKEWHQKEDAFLNKLKQLKQSDLEDKALQITYQLLKESLENSQAARICKDELWLINPVWGWHNVTTAVAEKQPVGTPYYRKIALKRFGSIEQLVDDEIHNLKLGLKEGYSSPKPVVLRVLKQLDIILNVKVEDSPYFNVASRDNDDAFKRQFAELISQKINPALKRYANYLENEYLPFARETIGLSAIPSGATCYAAKVRKDTTLSIASSAIYEYGLSHMRKLMLEVAEIGQRQFGIQDMTDVFHHAKNSTHSFFHSEADILKYNQEALERANAKVDAWFDTMPKAKGILKPYPLHRAKTGASGEYHPPSEDGKLPGIFYINTYQPEQKSRVDMEATLYHELIPGHHFQVALAQEDKSHHNLDKYLWNSGFGEGWALYVERLADEMALYCDDISRLGMLSNEALRTARLVVDPGIHVMGWSRDEAIDYLKKHTALSQDIIESEVDRYITMPGQATSYMLGKREIEDLRTLAKKQLGNRFDIREFHNQVLRNGAVTLPMLRTQVEEWLESQRL